MLPLKLTIFWFLTLLQTSTLSPQDTNAGQKPLKRQVLPAAKYLVRSLHLLLPQQPGQARRSRSRSRRQGHLFLFLILVVIAAALRTATANAPPALDTGAGAAAAAASACTTSCCWRCAFVFGAGEVEERSSAPKGCQNTRHCCIHLPEESRLTSTIDGTTTKTQNTKHTLHISHVHTGALRLNPVSYTNNWLMHSKKKRQALTE